MPQPVNDALLADARRLCDGQFRPRAEDADRGTIDGPVRGNVLALARAGYFGLGIPAAYGGFGADEPTKREYTETIAAACGVTAFVQQQLHAGGGFVGGGRSDALKQEWLPRFASGEVLCGVAFSHLRRGGTPMVTAVAVNGGYVVNGVAPWVTGWALLDCFILGATLPDGNHLFVLAIKSPPPRSGTRPTAKVAGQVVAGPVMPLVVMNASDTREVAFTDFFVPDEYVLSERPAESLKRSDFCGISGHVFLPLGCARGSVRYLRELGDKRGDNATLHAAEAFACEIDTVRETALTWNGTCADRPDYMENALRARAEAVTLAVRAAHAAVAATGGGAHLLTSPPQRLLREAIFYTTTAQTPDVRTATLDLLVSPDCWNGA